MDNFGSGGYVILVTLLFVAGVIFAVMLFLAPLKLYAIHREIRKTNELLAQQNQLITQQVAESSRIQATITAAIYREKNVGMSSTPAIPS
jgi:cell division protein FtsL